MSGTKIGIVGCGNISGIYFKNLCTVFQNVTVKACADLDEERAKAAAAEFDGIQVMTVDKLMADPEIEIVVNLTIPQAHFPISMQAVESGKCVHSEKPITRTREEGQKLLNAAEKQGVLVGNAPDTFMGGGIQTCRKLIDDGWIGRPIGAQAFMLCPGHESWHPDPEFYYKAGGGPMFDMGPYYLTALVSLLGPIKRVTGMANISFDERTITSEKKFGNKVKVEVPTHVTGIMDFASGVIGTIATSFDVASSEVPRIEIFGSQGTLSLPDPNHFGGPVRIRRRGAAEWSEIPLTHGYSENSRGIGPADMAAALKARRQPRANGKLALHILDAMHAFHEAAVLGRHVDIASTCDRPPPMPMDLINGMLD